ncbi:PepSY domain-containing protein [Methylocystis sp. ATCC 49242]|uniref:PepSY-associated TM helix domain-containing protein n=1 Tax=Methylocystis sp. ATCC 49242 TaxID=622637 RepID=UPI0001F87870|nr:PepSY-associated TM helix domain-containing protein [Methylocystis sp. ATCC 49242]
MTARSFCVIAHRWAGLSISGFVIVVGLSGALLAFFGEFNRWLSPELFPPPHPGATLDAATLARRAEAIAPQARIDTIYLGNPGTVVIGVSARPGGAPLSYNQLFLDPVSGAELGRRKIGAWPRRLQEAMPFVYRLHMTLAVGEIGAWLLGVASLVWTIDCFAAFYLTLPPPGEHARKSYLQRWRASWVLKRSGSFYRLNVDLHRAGGLWLWAALFVFAWSGVYMNLNSVYSRVTETFFDYQQPLYFLDAAPTHEREAPMSWEAARERGRALLDEKATAHGFTVLAEVALYRLHESGLYEYRVRSSRDIGEKYGQTAVWFDAATGALRQFALPTGLRAGNTLTTWLYELHKANVFGLPYRIFVAITGLATVVLSVTGVYIWLKKRTARRAAARDGRRALRGIPAAATQGRH